MDNVVIGFLAGLVLGAAGATLLLLAMVWAVKTARLQEDQTDWTEEERENNNLL